MKRAPDPFPLPRLSGNLGSFDRRITETADFLIDELARVRELPTSKKGLKREDVCWLTYALIYHRTSNGQALGEDHLRLLAAALKIRSGRMPSRAARFLGLPAIRSAHYPKMLAAADLDASDSNISEKELAKKVGVARKTIRLWRKMTPYRDRVKGPDQEIVARKWAIQARIKKAPGAKA